VKSRARYTISDGKLVLTLETAAEGAMVVTSPLDPELITEAETVEQAFDNLRDAAKALRQSRAKLLRKLPHPPHTLRPAQ
jgi:antitoxin HicB